MVNLMVILLVQCFVVDSWAKPSMKRTVNPPVDVLSFNSTQLIRTVKELTKEPGKFRRIATISLLMGAIRSEEQMEQELTRLLNDLVETFNETSLVEKEKKLKDISKFVQRDLRAMFILSSAIDLTQYNASVKEFQNSMREFALHEEELMPRLDRNILRNGRTPIETIQGFVNEHIQVLRSTLMNRVSLTIDALENDDTRKRVASNKRPTVANSSSESVESNSIPAKGNNATLRLGVREKNQDKDAPKEKAKKRGRGMAARGIVLQNPASDTLAAPAYYVPYQEEIMIHLDQLDRDRRQDDDDDDGEEFKPEDEGPGGLVGLIANLSGGDEGSDVGAVIGALTGVVARLLGPGGLDINGLLSTGTSLLAGLLGGDENFGKVLAGYVGTSLDGLSGGGGADNNGQFIGNIIGGVVAALSADPEDEDENPIKPGIFLRNVLMGSFQNLRKGQPEGEEGEDRKDELRRQGVAAKQKMMTMVDKGDPHAQGSDVFGFITGIIGAVVGGVKSIIFNSIAGLSSGASKGSLDLSAKVIPPLSSGSDGVAAALIAY